MLLVRGPRNAQKKIYFIVLDFANYLISECVKCDR